MGEIKVIFFLPTIYTFEKEGLKFVLHKSVLIEGEKVEHPYTVSEYTTGLKILGLDSDDDIEAELAIDEYIASKKSIDAIKKAVKNTVKINK